MNKGAAAQGNYTHARLGGLRKTQVVPAGNIPIYVQGCAGRSGADAHVSAVIEDLRLMNLAGRRELGYLVRARRDVSRDARAGRRQGAGAGSFLGLSRRGRR